MAGSWRQKEIVIRDGTVMLPGGMPPVLFSWSRKAYLGVFFNVYSLNYTEYYKYSSAILKCKMKQRPRNGFFLNIDLKKFSYHKMLIDGWADISPALNKQDMIQYIQFHLCMQRYMCVYLHKYIHIYLHMYKHMPLCEKYQPNGW